MQAQELSFILKLVILIIALISISFGCFLFYKKLNRRVGSITLAGVKIGNSAAGVFFVGLGALIILLQINSGTDIQRTEIKQITTTTSDSTGAKTVINEVHVISDTASSDTSKILKELK